MSPYSMYLISNQALESAGEVSQSLRHPKEIERKEKKEKAKLAYNKMCRGGVVQQGLSGRLAIQGSSASSFFPMGPEEEVFDIELGEGNSVFLRADLSPPFRGQRTPGPRGTRALTPKAPKPRRSLFEDRCFKRRRSFKCEEVMEYAVDTFLWKRQLINKYMVSSGEPLDSDITGDMRQTLLQWLSTIARQLELSLETWCLSVNYLDRFMAVQPLDKECLQLAGLTSLLVAGKVEEQNPLEMLELVSLCASAYTRANFRHMEVILLSKLEFELLAPTPSFLLAHLVQIRGEKDWPQDLSRHMIEMCLCCEEISQYSPLEIANSIYTVLKCSDPNALASVLQYCPICQPALGDIYSREFVVVCFEEISDNIRKTEL